MRKPVEGSASIEMSGLHPHRAGPDESLVAQRQRRRHDARLVPRLGVVVAGEPAAAAVVRHRQPGAHRGLGAAGNAAHDVGRALEGASGGPAELARLLAVRPDLERRAAHRGDERAGRRVVGRGEAEQVEVVAVVPGGEQDAHPGRVGQHEQVVERGPGGHVVEEVSGVVAPRVGDHVGQAVVDDVLLGVEQAVDAVLGADVEDVRVRCHRVHGLDVDRLLGQPARSVALSPSSLNGVALSWLKCAFANGLPGSFILK